MNSDTLLSLFTFVGSVIIIGVGVYLFRKCYDLYQKSQEGSEVWLYLSLTGIIFAAVGVTQTLESIGKQFRGLSNSLLAMLMLLSVLFLFSFKKHYNNVVVENSIKVIENVLPNKKELSACGYECMRCDFFKVGKCLGCKDESKIREEPCAVWVCVEKKGISNCFECENRYSCDIFDSIPKRKPYMQQFTLKKGQTYIIEKEKSLKIFERIMKSGCKGVLVTDRMDGNQKFENVYMIMAYDSDLRKLYEDISSFVENNSVVLLSDFSNLTKKCNGDDIRNFLFSLMETTVSTDSNLIISLDKNHEMMNELSHLVADFYTVYMIQSVSNPMRKNILEFLSENGKTSFSEMLKSFKIKSAPKLSFHLKELKKNKLIAQDTDNLYYITRQGRQVLKFLLSLKEEVNKNIKFFED